MADTPLDLAEGRRLLAEATPGPVAWRGYVDRSIELRTLHSGGLRVITTIRPDPCIWEAEDGGPTLAAGACQSCRRYFADLGNDRKDPCDKPENLNTLWLQHPGGGHVSPINAWATREVPYRGDVASVDHPDARKLVWLWNNAEALIAAAEERDRLSQAIKPHSAGERLRRSVMIAGRPAWRDLDPTDA
jgi:hypothetical protein